MRNHVHANYGDDESVCGEPADIADHGSEVGGLVCWVCGEVDLLMTVSWLGGYRKCDEGDLSTATERFVQIPLRQMPLPNVRVRSIGSIGNASCSTI